MKLFILFLALLFSSALGVKEYLFKNCDNSGFCHRNRFFANHIKSNLEYNPKYFIDPVSIEVSDVIRADVVKALPNGLENVIFPLEISILEGDSVHVKVNEARSSQPGPGDFVNPNRYDETANWAFSRDIDTMRQTVEPLITNDKITMDLGTVEVVFNLNPVKVVILVNGSVQCIVNDRNFLNIEHYRNQEANSKHLHPEETEFDMFSDSFADAKDDSIPLGPESLGLDFTFPGFKNVYGIPEHADSFNLKDTVGTSHPYRLYNVDIFEYETDSRLPMYGSIPFMLALKPDASIGVFWVNSADTFIDIQRDQDTTQTHWISENGVMEFIIMTGSTPLEINKKYTEITGPVQLPQLASLGYHQCRWNYNDEKDVLDINDLMDKHQIPYDYIWLDIEYAESKKYFTWNKENFPNPQRMLSKLDHTGRNLVVIIDPHLKTDYFVSDEVDAKRITMNSFKNETYHGHCWPGESIWLDSLNPLSQQLWDKYLELSSENTFMGGEEATNIQIWNDMNEPSIFNGPETTSPRDNLHYGNWEHRSIHNVFGLTLHELTYSSMIKRYELTPRQRPFILTRSYFAGSQRTAAMWSGDNMSTWEYLKISIPMVLTSGVSGMPFAGADVGGFFGNPSKELLTRWYQTGIWYPFFRAHAHIDSRRREPWVPGEPYTSHIREAIQLRYALLPMIYTTFYESTKTGVPVMKPIFYESLEFLENFDIEDQFFLGNTGILVKPVTDENAQEIKIRIPDSSIYYSFNNGRATGNSIVNSVGYITEEVDLNTIPMLLKGGSVIATKERARRSSRLMQRDPYTLTIALDAEGNALGKLYVDDGESFNYQKGEFLEIEFEMSNGKISSKINAGVSLNADVKIEKISILSQNKVKCTSVEIEQGGMKWTTSCVEGEITIIKKPNVSISSNWNITLQEGAVVREVEKGLHDEL